VRPPTSECRRAPLLPLLAVLSAAALANVRSLPPTPRGIDAPASEFSSERALAAFSRVAGTSPRPVGSEEHERVRERLLAELRGLGLEPSVLEGAAATSTSIALARNVVARIPGKESAKSVLLCAHYDSVAAGPGAGDDGSGVATLLEVARALREDGPAQAPDRPPLHGRGGVRPRGRAGLRPPLDRAGGRGRRQRRRARDRGPDLPLRDEPRQRRPRAALRALRPAALRDLRRVRGLQADAERHGPDRVQAARHPGPQLRVHRRRREVPHTEGRPRAPLAGEPAARGRPGARRGARARGLGVPREGGDGPRLRGLLGVVLVRWPEAASLPASIAVLLVLLAIAARDVRRGGSSAGAIAGGLLLALATTTGAAVLAPAIVHGIELVRGNGQPGSRTRCRSRLRSWPRAPPSRERSGARAGSRSRTPPARGSRSRSRASPSRRSFPVRATSASFRPPPRRSRVSPAGAGSHRRSRRSSSSSSGSRWSSGSSRRSSCASRSRSARPPAR
jgi:hypothetical protein